MTIDEFIEVLEHKLSSLPEGQLETFEAEIGSRLPEDYRQFLYRTNGGYIRTWLQFQGRTPEGRSPSHFVSNVVGLREEPDLSLRVTRRQHIADPGPQAGPEIKIPPTLLLIMSDPSGNGFCLGLIGKYHGKVYFWVHDEPPSEEEWDGEVETAANIALLANSFTDFISGVGPTDLAK